MFFFKSTIGLVLGGGGARGFFHIGVIKAIQKLGLKIDKISGTSIGAVIGAIYANNPSADLEKIALELDYLKIIKSFPNTEKLLKNFVHATDFSDLKIPLCFNATDVNRAQEIVFNQGPLFPALLATISVPGVFPPVKIDDHYLVDGGIINNVPVSLIPDTTRLIVSDITSPIKPITSQTLPLNVFYSSFALMQHQAVQSELNKVKKQKMTQLTLQNDEVFILDFRKQNYQKLIDLGFAAMMSSNFRP